jgi:Uma2 family endonuclease
MLNLNELLLTERPRRIAREEYDRMIEMGLFEGEHVELLHGVIIEMAPIGPPHTSPVELLNELLVPRLLGRARVRIQMPYLGADESEPEPDVAVVPVGNYNAAHPDRAHLVIEVANSSLRKDKYVKAPLYAMSNVNEYWLVNLAAKCVEVHRDPSGDGWGQITRHERSATLSIAAFPDVTVKIADFLL